MIQSGSDWHTEVDRKGFGTKLDFIPCFSLCVYKQSQKSSLVLTIEKLNPKTSYIHSYMLLICSLGHSKYPIFSTKFTAMKTLKFGIHKINKFKFYNFKNVFQPCHKICTCIKKSKGIKCCLLNFQSLFYPLLHVTSLIATFNHFVQIAV